MVLRILKYILIALGVLFALSLIAVIVSGGPKKRSRAARAAAVAEPVVDAAPPADARPPLVFPTTHAPAAKILGHSKRDVRKLLDPLGRYDDFSDDGSVWSIDRMVVRTKYANGRTVELRVGAGEDIPADAALAWLELAGRNGQTVNGRRYFVRVEQQVIVITDIKWAEQEAEARAIEAEEADCADGKEKRETLANFIEEHFLNKGRMDTKVSARGECGEKLRVVWILCGRVWVNDFVKMNDEDSVPWTARRAGFTSVECSNGYDQTWRGEL